MKKSGFTLIELLVVIGIVAMLVAVALPNYLSARQRAADSKKKNEMVELKKALRLYYNDFNHYPSGVAGGINGVGNGLSMYGCGTGGASSCTTTCTPGFASGASCDNLYMKQLPSGFLSTTFYYQAGSTLGDDFCLSVLLDNKSDPDITTSQDRCRSVCSSHYSVSNKYWICAD